MNTFPLRLLAAGVAMSMLLSACVVAPGPGYGRGSVVYDDVAVTDAEPPPPQYEAIGIAPSPGYFWISGVWFWEGGRHVWHPGRWEAPRAGYRYVPHTWEHVGNSWHLRGGRWEKHH